MKKSKLPTVALHMIVKDEVEPVMDLLINALPYVNEAVVTVSDKDAYKRFKKLMADYDVKFDHRPWTNDFGAARNHNMALSKTDFIFWVDADDAFDFSTLPKLLGYADANNYDAIYLPYNYAQDEQDNTIALHWRERLIRRSRGFEWRGKIHESMLPADDGTFKAKKLDQPEVKHLSKDVEGSKERNHEILKEAVEGKEPEEVDPRDVYYYGLSCFGLGNYRGAIAVLEDYMELSGWGEEMYRALIKISEAYFMMDKHADAIEHALKASALMPELAEAYFALARYEYALAKWSHVLEWLEVAFSKPRYDGMSVQNPEVYELAKIYSAVSHYSLKNYQTAYKHLMAAPKHLREDLEDGFKVQANLEIFINLVPELIRYIPGSAIWNALDPIIRYDERLKWLRNDVKKPKTWPKKSIVFFCGEAYEPWGAHTLDKGMGGSEEAVVYLSREFAEMGYEVHVYNHQDGNGYMDTWERPGDPHSGEAHTPKGGSVTYHPWREFDERDQFDTLVVWRSPEYGDGLNARVKITDLHDVLTPEMVTERPDTTYFVKTKFHRSLYPNAPDDNFEIIGNGIKVSHFKKNPKKDPNLVLYTSAYYRGAETLVNLWPKIKEQVPDAKLKIAYGWASWVKIQGEDAFYKRMTKKLEKAKDLDVEELGRLNHEDLAKLMDQASVWAYPTEFPEIHCITALKMQQAGAYPVTTDVAALDETVQSGVKLESATIYSDEYQQKKFVDEVVAALKKGKRGTPVKGVDWSDVAKKWIKHIEKGGKDEVS